MIRKILSVASVLLVLFSGISISFATHYCRGSVSATRISLTGAPATCGMEEPEATNSSGVIITRHCCENVISWYSLARTYVSSEYNINAPRQQVLFCHHVPVTDGNMTGIFVNISDKIRPPGTNCPAMPDQPALCVFRI